MLVAALVGHWSWIVRVVAAMAVCMAGEVISQPFSPKVWVLNSPGKRTEFTLRFTPEQGLEYRIRLNQDGDIPSRVAVDWSSLGIVTSLYDNFDLQKAVVSDFSGTITFVAADTSNGEDTYSMPTGKRRENHARYSQLSLTFRDDESGRILRIDARTYDEGVAFRYVLPESDLLYHRLDVEYTAFNIGLGGRHWGAPYGFPTKYGWAYESAFSSVATGSPVPSDTDAGWSFPSLFEHNGLWVLLHESGLDASFHGSHLQPTAPDGVYRIAPPLQEETMGFGANFPTAPLPWIMPWRFMVISDELGDIVESNLVFHLAPASRLERVDWVQPGIASWNWASDHDSGLDQAELRAFIDLAAEMGWPYTLIDANWNLSGDNAMADLVSHAEARNVGLFFWYNSGGRHNSITEQPRNIMDDRVLRRAEFAQLEALGVRGVKVDFFLSDKQDRIRHYVEILEDAADHHLMVNFHGCTVPRGWQRTWPNLVTMEAVHGGEFYSFDWTPKFSEIAPGQSTIHPFLRNVIGSMDYTPVLFSPFPNKRLTTNAHEAALGVLFESGVQHMIDRVSAYRTLPESYKTYLRSLPAAWDETRFIAGQPGSFVVLARRFANQWYIAGINGTEVVRDISFRLSLLPGAIGEALILYDDDRNPFSSRQRTFTVDDTMHMTMQGNGGFVILFDD